MIRILHILPALDGGGVETVLLNYYTKMDKDKYRFDFIVHGDEVGALESVFEGMNSKIFHIPAKRKSITGNLRAMKQIISTGNYDVIHAHQGTIAVFPMYYSKKSGIRVRITHSHIAYEEKGALKRIIDKTLLPFLKKYSTHWFACGRDAGISLWGKKSVDHSKVTIMKNAIDIDKFVFDATIRKQKRKEFGIENKFVIGSVARLSYQKNHEFLIHVFNEIYKIDKNAILLLTGRGELEGDIKKQIKDLGLDKVVKLLGIRDDVHHILQAMDVFVLPSRYEGLGIVYIESQASGLPCFGSDIVVPYEVKVTNLMNFISLEKPPEYWAKEILKYKDAYERGYTFDKIKQAGYDIKNEASELELFYKNA